MKAALLTGRGGSEVVTVGERPSPVPGPGEVLVHMLISKAQLQPRGVAQSA